MPAEVMTEQDKEFQAEDDLRTLRRARDIQGSSSRLKAAKALATKEIKALGTIGSTLLTKSK